MVRILVIGRSASGWAGDIAERTGESVHLDTERLPAAGIRRLESTPPDAVIAADEDPSRIEMFADALRDRPLGKLIPLALISPRPDDAQQRVEKLKLLDWLSPQIAAGDVVDLLEEALDTPLRGGTSGAGPSPRQDATSSTTQPSPPDQTDRDGAASYLGGDVVLEPVELVSAPKRIEPDEVFGHRRDREDPDEALTPEQLERKLQQVRHEDYYAILEVRRGAETPTVRQAFHTLYSRFDPESLPFELVREHREDIEEIRDALEDAFAVLADPELRRQYLEHTVQ